MRELNEFAQRTLEELIALESRVTMGSRRSISMFCRMDIGLRESEDGRLHYFVNEIERTHSCALWAGMGDTYRAVMIGEKLGQLLVQWMDMDSL